MLRILAAFTLFAFPSAALEFTLNFSWTPVAGLGSDSADIFSFEFLNPSNQLQITNMSVTLGNGLIYDLQTGPPGYLTSGPYSDNGAGGSTLTSAPLSDGGAGNRTAAWSFTSFTSGNTFVYSADVDENGNCSLGAGYLLCLANRDSVAPSGFVDRGAIDLTLVISGVGGGPAQTFTFPASGQSWSAGILSTRATTQYTGDYNAVPEPSTWALGIAGLALCGLSRIRRR